MRSFLGFLSRMSQLEANSKPNWPHRPIAVRSHTGKLRENHEKVGKTFKVSLFTDLVFPQGGKWLEKTVFPGLFLIGLFHYNPAILT